MSDASLVEDLESEIITLEWKLSEATKAAEFAQASQKEVEQLRAAVEKHHELSDEEDDRSLKCSTCGLPWLP